MQPELLAVLPSSRPADLFWIARARGPLHARYGSSRGDPAVFRRRLLVWVSWPEFSWVKQPTGLMEFHPFQWQFCGSTESENSHGWSTSCRVLVPSFGTITAVTQRSCLLTHEAMNVGRSIPAEYCLNSTGFETSVAIPRQQRQFQASADSRVTTHLFSLCWPHQYGAAGEHFANWRIIVT